MYLTICFMASIRRMKSIPHKRILLVCGHGYGTTTMLKESLLSEYQIHIMDTIPLYKIPSYPDWVMIDYVFSTVELNNKLPKPCIMVNPILRPEARAAIEGLGISRKTILSSYYAIEEKLGFLDEKTRARVMDVIERKFGYQTVKNQHNPKSFSSFLKYDCIARMDQNLEWRQAVRKSAGLLINRGFIEEAYVEHMIDFIEENGFYAVSDGSFALLHGKGVEGIRKTSLSLLANKKPVWFGEKQVKVIFCLASKDAKEHITEEEIYRTILNCEFEVL